MHRFDWRRIAIYIGILVACAIPASASPPSFCCTATSGQTITAANWNNSFSPLYSALNGNIDSTFISTNGIGANQIKSTCSGCTGIFGFAATFSNTATFNPASAGSIPVTVTNASLPTADYLDVTPNGGSAGGVWSLSSVGNVTTAGVTSWVPGMSTTSTSTLTAGAASVITVANTQNLFNGETIQIDTGGAHPETNTIASFTQTTITPNGNWGFNHGPGVYTVVAQNAPSGSTVGIWNDGQAIQGLDFNVPTNSTKGYRFFRNGTATLLMQLQANGNFKVPIGSIQADNNGTLATAPTMLTGGGSDAGGNAQVQTFQVSVALSGNPGTHCANLTVCLPADNTFASGLNLGTEGCGANIGETGHKYIPIVAQQALSGYTVSFFNISGGNLNDGTTLFANIICGAY